MSSRCLRTLLLVLPLLAVACGDDSDEGTQPQPTPPTVREIQPTGGPIAGNTLLNVYGSGFQDGAKVYLGDLELQRTVVVNAFRIYGYTPTATSAQVDVRVVNPDGAYGVLVKGFTYEGPPAPNIDQAEVLNGNTDAVSGGQPVGVTVRGAITVAGLTRGVGQGGGVRAQVGFAPGTAEVLKQDSYTWEAATYETDSDSGEADVYKGNVLLQPPIGGENREWVVAMRFSIDGGKTWVMADGDGIANGVSAEMMRRVFIARPRVDYCKLGPDGNGANPELFYKPTDSTLVTVLGQVYAAGITQGAGAGSGVVAQLGIGPDGSDPRTSEGWTWVNATYKAEHGNNDEWGAELPNPGTEGKYRIAFRFSISENAWRVCDADGVNDSTEGNLTFNLGKLGTLTVGNEAPKPQVGWCKIGEDQKAPEVINYLTTQTSGQKTVYAQVFMAGVTDKVGAGPGLTGQLGWGPASEDPRTSALWNWSTNLAWNKDNFTVNDEWKAVLPNPGVNGEYRYAVRFAANGGPVRVCDGNGVDDGGQDFELNQLGTLNVTGEVVVPKTIGYCKLGPDGNNTPETATYLTTTTTLRKVVGQVYVQGVTTTPGKGDNVVAQLGWGPPGDDPTTSANWNWATAAAYKGDIGQNNDEYEASLPNPTTVGSYRFAYRFQVNGGAFLYCDADGTTEPLGFDKTKTGTLTVSEPPTTNVIDYCKLGPDGNNTPPSLTYTTASQPSHVVVGYVNVAGLTNTTAGAASGVVGQFGYGPANSDPSTSAQWTWAAAQFKSDFFDNDEYQATLPNPGSEGSYRFAYRFQVNGGAYRYCDADGSSGTDGFDAAKVGTLTVEPVQVPTGMCRLQSVSADAVGSGASVTATGRVRIPGVTDGAGAGANLQVQVGLGDATVDASGNPAAFTWKAATYTQEAPGEANTDEFALTFAPAYTGSRAVSLRYSTDGSTWTYCDKDGSDMGGYTVAQQHALTVNKHAEIDYCNLQWPLVISASRTVYGKIYEPGVTNVPPPTANVTAELGYGPKTQDPGLGAGWTWIAGTVNGDSEDADEYKVDMPAGVPVGSSYLWRFRVGTGAYCFGDWQPSDQDGGSNNGVSPDTLGTVDQVLP
ncbi:IPT/TIG domain-containing protein [Pyxidicoccus parkwayensis]|uniref:IPT/TIG domain-containing protein n=1 Tax=Pyxidicoccus parkwayensis TaxID=2813578 RepID=A0ABX7NZ93_9BACT|nr:IPT/TIG domain-containing protein [Pyxidicoccus parkwaysis]QSQ24237.1 IPT/TIG domain-containing protein [Pyxidicoccus parkwaysis]